MKYQTGGIYYEKMYDSYHTKRFWRMAVKYSSPKKYAVRNFLMRSVREMPPEPTRLMTELALCRKFNVNRETVRNAIHDLELSRVVHRIPGKKGIYSNPAFSRSSIRYIGIVNGCPGEPYLHPFENRILAHITFELGKKIPFRFQFPRLPDAPALAVELLHDFSFDAVLWLHFTSVYHDWLDALNPLLQEKYPLVVVNRATDDPLEVHLDSNMIGVDYAAWVNRRISYLTRMLVGKNIVYLGSTGTVDLLFQRTLKSARANFGKMEFLHNTFLAPDEISAALKRTNADALICNDDSIHCRNACRVLSGSPEFNRVQLFLAAHTEFLQFKRDFPNVDLVFADDLLLNPDDFAPVIVKQLEKILSGGETCFQNIYR